MNFNEEFLYYVWKNKLFNKDKLKDADENYIEVIDTGTLNTDSGPDFFNAKVKINDTIWAGNVEIHINSSDWYRHLHNKNKAYDNVILHIVATDDKEVLRTDGTIIPTAVLYYDKTIYERYKYLVNTTQILPCASYIKDIDMFTLNSWLTVALYERLEEKTNLVKQIFKKTKNNWEETFYIIMAKAFGFKVNSLPFELLSKSLPLHILGKHKNNIFQIEALLFGQAGLLNEKYEEEDEYYNKLQKEYSFLQKKYNLAPTEGHLWKFMRLRPANFPTIRISQFAVLINKSNHLFSKVINSQNIKELQALFVIQSGIYWNNHYRFGKTSIERTKRLGKGAINNLIINTIIPILFIYGKEKDDEEIISKALGFLEELKAEKNYITKGWQDAGFEIKNAFFSQAVISLHNNYCSKNNCLNCRIGNKII